MSSSIVRPRPFSDAVLDRLARLAPRAERSSSLYSTPLGPDENGLYLPRFALFGSNTADSDAHITVLAGFTEGDDASSLAAFDLIEAAAAAPESIGGVVVEVVPLVNRGAGDLWSASWVHSGRPELALLEREFRRVPPHALVQVRQGSGRYPQGLVRDASIGHWLDGAPAGLLAAGWLPDTTVGFPEDGIDALVPDLPFRPLELRLTLGRDPLGNSAALHAIVQRTRQLLAHAQHL